MIKGKTEVGLTVAVVQSEIDELETYSKARLKMLRALLRVLQEEEKQADDDPHP